tara:strand:+ start:81 stop:626 length:546 start_codon:yes stop_codon:yes gene_type:complete
MLDFKKNGIKNISLIGLMGSGKSVIGKSLSKLFNTKYFDTDLEIEKLEGRSIEEIFTNDGEVYFRDIEEEICLNILNNENCIISLGGGSVINSKIRNMMQKNSYSIYLKVDIGELEKRLRYSRKRPLLNNEDKKKVIQNLYEQRKIFYENADLVIENNFDKIEVITNIQEKINKTWKKKYI